MRVRVCSLHSRLATGLFHGGIRGLSALAFLWSPLSSRTTGVTRYLSFLHRSEGSMFGLSSPSRRKRRSRAIAQPGPTAIVAQFVLMELFAGAVAGYTERHAAVHHYSLAAFHSSCLRNRQLPASVHSIPSAYELSSSPSASPWSWSYRPSRRRSW